jgi:transcriptional regulator with XRE-family HTH domain
MWVRPEEHKVVGKVLAAARAAQDLSQAQVAKRLEKPQSFVSSYENGQRRIDLLEFLRIMAALELDPLAEFAQIAKKHGGRKR